MLLVAAHADALREAARREEARAAQSEAEREKLCDALRRASERRAHAAPAPASANTTGSVDSGAADGRLPALLLQLDARHRQLATLQTVDADLSARGARAAEAAAAAAAASTPEASARLFAAAHTQLTELCAAVNAACTSLSGHKAAARALRQELVQLVRTGQLHNPRAPAAAEVPPQPSQPAEQPAPMPREAEGVQQQAPADPPPSKAASAAEPPPPVARRASPLAPPAPPAVTLLGPSHPSKLAHERLAAGRRDAAERSPFQAIMRNVLASPAPTLALGADAGRMLD